MQHVVAAYDVVHQYARRLQTAIDLGLVHVQGRGHAADAEGGEVYLVRVHTQNAVCRVQIYKKFCKVIAFYR